MNMLGYMARGIKIENQIKLARSGNFEMGILSWTIPVRPV